jgi:hypothetical protein
MLGVSDLMALARAAQIDMRLQCNRANMAVRARSYCLGQPLVKLLVVGAWACP